MNKVSESIFDGKQYVIPMADVQHIEKTIEKEELTQICIVTKHTKYSIQIDWWENAIWIQGDEAKKFMKCWCCYRRELENNFKELTK